VGRGVGVLVILVVLLPVCSKYLRGTVPLIPVEKNNINPLKTQMIFFLEGIKIL
jgi:hypothetical protein